MYLSKYVRLLGIGLLCIGLLAAQTAHTTSAQATPSAPSTSNVCSCVQKALDLLGKYNIPPTALNELLPLLNSPQELVTKLHGYGLTDDQVGGLVKEAAPLVQNAGLNPGAVQDFVAQGAENTLEKNKISAAQLDDLVANKDPQAVSAELQKNGLSADEAKQVQGDLNFYEALGLDKQAHAHLIAHDAIDLMGKYGLPPTALAQLLPLVTQPDVLAAELGKLGVAADKIPALIGEAAPLIQEGLNANLTADYVAQAAVDELFGKGLPADKYAEVLALRNDANAFAAELEKDGLSQADIAEVAKNIADDNALGLTDQNITEAQQSLQDDAANLDKAVDPDGDGKIGDDAPIAEPADHPTGDDNSQAGGTDGSSGSQDNSGNQSSSGSDSGSGSGSSSNGG